MSMGSEAESRILSAMDACIEAGSPGVILAIEAPGRSFSTARGLFERGGTRRLRAEDPFRAASVSKAVTAATAVRLAADGRWSLDDPVVRFLSADLGKRLGGLSGLSDVEALTLRRLLGHTSGIPDYFFDPRFQKRVRAEPDRTWRPVELAEAAMVSGRLHFEPGSDFSYGDSGFVLAGLAIERLTGRALADACRSIVFDPLGMGATWLEWHEPRRTAAISHHYEGDRDLTGTNLSFDWAGGGLATTAGDLVRFLHGLFGGGLFEDRWLAEMTAWRDGLRWPPDSSAHYLRYGLGLGVNRASGEEILGATGVWGAFAYYWPARDAAIAGTVNLRGVDREALLDSVVAALRDAPG